MPLTESKGEEKLSADERRKLSWKLGDHFQAAFCLLQEPMRHKGCIFDGNLKRFCQEKWFYEHPFVWRPSSEDLKDLEAAKAGYARLALAEPDEYAYIYNKTSKAIGLAYLFGVGGVQPDLRKVREYIFGAYNLYPSGRGYEYSELISALNNVFRALVGGGQNVLYDDLYALFYENINEEDLPAFLEQLAEKIRPALEAFKQEEEKVQILFSNLSIHVGNCDLEAVKKAIEQIKSASYCYRKIFANALFIGVACLQDLVDIQNKNPNVANKARITSLITVLKELLNNDAYVAIEDSQTQPAYLLLREIFNGNYPVLDPSLFELARLFEQKKAAELYEFEARVSPKLLIELKERSKTAWSILESDSKEDIGVALRHFSEPGFWVLNRDLLGRTNPVITKLREKLDLSSAVRFYNLMEKRYALLTTKQTITSVADLEQLTADELVQLKSIKRATGKVAHDEKSSERGHDSDQLRWDTLYLTEYVTILNRVFDDTRTVLKAPIDIADLYALTCFSFGRDENEIRNYLYNSGVTRSESFLGRNYNMVVNDCLLTLNDCKILNERIFNGLLVAAQNGNGVAMAEVARCYLFGIGVQENSEKGKGWYIKAISSKAADDIENFWLSTHYELTADRETSKSVCKLLCSGYQPADQRLARYEKEAAVQAIADSKDEKSSATTRVGLLLSQTMSNAGLISRDKPSLQVAVAQEVVWDYLPRCELQ